MIKLYPFFYIMFSLEVKLNDHVWSWSFHKTPLRVWRHWFLSKIIVQSVLHFINVLPNHFWMEKSWKMIHDPNWEDMVTKKKTCSNTIFLMMIHTYTHVTSSLHVVSTTPRCLQYHILYYDWYSKCLLHSLSL